MNKLRRQWAGKMTDEYRHLLETAAELLERLAYELVATNERLVQLEARVEALGRM